MEKQLNILLVEDQRLMADGLKSLLETQPDFKVVATAHDEQEALRCCNDLAELDLALIDIHLSNNGTNGLVLAGQIKTDFKEMKILILSMFDDLPYIQRAKLVGANGFISKNAPGIETVRVIREVGNGKDAWPLDLDEIEDIPIVEEPTPTEMEVLKYIVRGRSTAQIGIELAMLEATVSAHRSNIMQKNKLRTQNELLKFAEKCMRLYGVPPDPIFSVELQKFCVKLREKSNINVEFIGDTEGFNNPITQALIRVMEEAWNNIKPPNSTRNIFIELKQNSSRISFTIRADGKAEDAASIKNIRKGSNDALKRILEAIGGELLPADSDSTIIAVLPVRRQYYKPSTEGY
jgi:two-component system nitrate/nitrite response regulator NarL